MHAYIITGGNEETRSDYIKDLIITRSVSPHDCITIVPVTTSIGVESMRDATSRLSIHPLASPFHAVIVRDAHTMTTEAQNAFLKTLEEPVGNAIIILESKEPDALLPTILSRCQLINLGNATQYSDEEINTCIDTLKFFGEVSVGKRLQKIDAIAKTQADSLAFINLAISSLHKELERHNFHRANLLRNFLTARTQILGNVNPKLAMDHIFLYNGL